MIYIVLTESIECLQSRPNSSFLPEEIFIEAVRGEPVHRDGPVLSIQWMET